VRAGRRGARGCARPWIELAFPWPARPAQHPQGLPRPLHGLHPLPSSRAAPPAAASASGAPLPLQRLQPLLQGAEIVGLDQARAVVLQRGGVGEAGEGRGHARVCARVCVWCGGGRARQHSVGRVLGTVLDPCTVRAQAWARSAPKAPERRLHVAACMQSTERDSTACKHRSADAPRACRAWTQASGCPGRSPRPPLPARPPTRQEHAAAVPMRS
jgi:hypothetical protein